MDRTGHRSLDGVRTYKQIGEQQQQTVSQVLNDATNGKTCKIPPKKKPCTSEDSIQPTVAVSETSSHSVVSVNDLFVPVPPPTSSSSTVPSIHFSGCSSFTVNCYVMPKP